MHLYFTKKLRTNFYNAKNAFNARQNTKCGFARKCCRALDIRLNAKFGETVLELTATKLFRFVWQMLSFNCETKSTTYLDCVNCVQWHRKSVHISERFSIWILTLIRFDLNPDHVKTHKPFIRDTCSCASIVD